MTAIINGIQYIGGQTAPNEFINNQAQTIDEKGYAGEFLLAFAANYNHKLCHISMNPLLKKQT